MEAFLISLGIIFVAELGDKCQLMAMTFAARYRAVTILIAITAATAFVHLFSVLVGAAAGVAMPTKAISVVAGHRILGFRSMDAPRPQWEYTSVTARTFDVETLMVQLSAAGSLGWELVGITAVDPTIGINRLTAILKATRSRIARAGRRRARARVVPRCERTPHAAQLGPVALD
jgi:Uncharacterized protein family UPF0016